MASAAGAESLAADPSDPPDGQPVVPVHDDSSSPKPPPAADSVTASTDPPGSAPDPTLFPTDPPLSTADPPHPVAAPPGPTASLPVSTAAPPGPTASLPVSTAAPPGLAAGGCLLSPTARADLVIVCDLFARRRGCPQPGEVCHIIGGGPIPVDVAKELARDAFLKAVLHDGINIHTVKHFGRHIRAALRTALDLGPVPEFTGRRCVDCGNIFRLKGDHDHPLGNGGATEFSNIKVRCWSCHQTKTKRDREAGLLRGNRR